MDIKQKLHQQLNAGNLFTGTYLTFMSVPGMTPSMAASLSHETGLHLMASFQTGSRGQESEYWYEQIIELNNLYAIISTGILSHEFNDIDNVLTYFKAISNG